MNKSRLLMSLCLCAGLAACSSAQIARDEASALMESGQYEAGLARIEQGLRENPRDTDLHMALNNGRTLAVKALLAQADMDRAQSNFAGARMTYSRVLNIEPNNRRAQDSLRQLDYLRSMEQYPQLRTRLNRPVTLEFRDANLKTIFKVLSLVAGLNFIFDKDLRPDMKTTIFVREVRIEDAVELMLQQNQLHQKVENENTLLIYPDSPHIDLGLQWPNTFGRVYLPLHLSQTLSVGSTE
jgi:general secretion pathway protein D